MRLKRRMGRKIRWFRRLSWKKKALIAAAPIVVFAVLIPLLTYFYFARDIADVERLMNRNNTGVILYANDGETEIFSTGQAGHRTPVPLDKISPELQKAVIASEDKNFYEHGGFSILSTLRAVYGYVINRGGSFGGSTITQQLAKITLLGNNRSFMRQYQAFSVAVGIENRYTKDEILEMYLNSVYFGENAFGIEDAAKVYFNTTPDNLNLAQSAMLIGVLPAPSIYSPISGDPELAKERQAIVLDRMVENDMISDAERQAALDEQLAYAEPQTSAGDQAPHFVQMVLSNLYEEYGEENVKRSGYQVTTTLDNELQQQLKQNITNHIGFIQANGGSNAAGVAIDPGSGSVLALVGSADWNNPEWGKVNLVTSPRQPGSSFKPIYYSRALDTGVITPATILHDVPTDFGNYQPQNADRRFRGDITVRSALSQSLNIPSVEVLQKLGIASAIEGAEKLGITTIDENKEYGLSLALGSAEVPLIEMTSAYAAFANEGQLYEAVLVKEINDKFNETVYRAPKAVTTPALSPEGAYLISSILSDNAARAPIFGSTLTVPGRTAAVKTGTTDEQRDAWTIGYTPQLALGVWVGNNDNAPMLNGGSGMAGPIWVNTMSGALMGTPDTPFTIPAGIVQRAVCFGQEALATRGGYGTFNEYFKSSALPERTCVPIDEPEPEPEEEKPEEQEEDSENKEDEDTPPPSEDENGGGGGENEEEPDPGNNDGQGGGNDVLPFRF